MRISDWSSDVCSSDLRLARLVVVERLASIAHLALGAAQRPRDLAQRAAELAHQVAELAAELLLALRVGVVGALLTLALALLAVLLRADRKSTRLHSSH